MSKIILDCDLMKYPDSGLFHYCLNLGSHVRKSLEKENHRLQVYVPGPELSSLFEGTDCIIEKKWHHKFFKPFLWKCDLWHAPFQSGRIIPMHNTKTKVLLTIHDLNCLHEDKTAKERRLSLQHTQKLIDRADGIVCISNHCKKDVITNLDAGNTPVYVIHNGTHHVHIPPQKPMAYLPGKPFLFTMGYVNRKKNFHTLIPLLKNNNIELIIAGKLDEPDYIHRMQREAEESGVHEQLKILGPIPEEDKAWYFKNCEAFMMPSLAEGFGAPVVEAMAFGKPLFLSDRTSLPEIGGDVAFYFNSFEADHMRLVFDEGMNEYRKNGLAEKIVNRGIEFSWNEKAAQYLKVYQYLLDK